MHVVLFDIDGTLISSGGAGKLAVEAALRSEFGVTDPSQEVSYAGRTDRAISRDLFLHHGIVENAANWQRFLTAYLCHLPVCLRQHEGRVLPGIGDLLAHLSERDDMLIGLLTGNVRQGANHKLERYGLAHHFEFGGFGDLHCDRNDVAREALGEVQGRLKDALRTDRLWVIGDTRFDVICGRAIGARVIAVATGGHSLAELETANPDCLLADCSDPAPLLALWE